MADRMTRIREWVDENQTHEVHEATEFEPEECTDECAWCALISILEENEAGDDE